MAIRLSSGDKDALKLKPKVSRKTNAHLDWLKDKLLKVHILLFSLTQGLHT